MLFDDWHPEGKIGKTMITAKQTNQTLETQLEAAVAVLKIFTGHYPGGINPDLDLAWSKARILLSELDDEEDAILGNDGSQNPRETRHRVISVEWREPATLGECGETAITVAGCIGPVVRAGDEIIYVRAE